MACNRTLLHLQFPACAEHMAVVRQKLRETLSACGQPAEQTNSVVLAVGEACMNIIQHAYGPDDRGDIVLDVELENGKAGEAGSELIFRLTDFASRKTCAAQLKSRPLDEIRPGGLGCFIMQQVMDEVKLLDCDKPGTNVLQLRKKVQT
jgi:anti-sigma regulatory factor (Ser/Thr protein kinase)